MSNKICRYCFNQKASSREHLIADSRLKTINSFKKDDEANDNIQKTYKGITCESCNNKLGEYEELRWSNLAYATLWKVLAGNINGVFGRYPEYNLINTSKKTIENYESQILDIIKTKKIMPNNTFSFDFDPMNSELTNKFGVAVKKVQINLMDEQGKPIEGGKVYAKDKGGGNKEKGYQITSDKYGSANLDILTRMEMIKVLNEKLIIKNKDTNEIKTQTIDFLTYVSFNSNNHRLIIMLPLIGNIQTGWSNARIEMRHIDFLNILQRNFSELSIKALNKYFKE